MEAVKGGPFVWVRVGWWQAAWSQTVEHALGLSTWKLSSINPHPPASCWLRNQGQVFLARRSDTVAKQKPEGVPSRNEQSLRPQFSRKHTLPVNQHHLLDIGKFFNEALIKLCKWFSPLPPPHPQDVRFFDSSTTSHGQMIFKTRHACTSLWKI